MSKKRPQSPPARVLDVMHLTGMYGPGIRAHVPGLASAFWIVRYNPGTRPLWIEDQDRSAVRGWP